MHRSWTLAAVAGLSVVLASGGCGNETPTEDDCCVVWMVDVISGSQVTGVEIRLDGESLYRETTATKAHHTVERYRSVGVGQHTVEVQLLAADTSPVAVRGRVLWQNRPGGTFSTEWFNDVPLNLGDVYALTVRQE